MRRNTADNDRAEGEYNPCKTGKTYGKLGKHLLLE